MGNLFFPYLNLILIFLFITFCIIVIIFQIYRLDPPEIVVIILINSIDYINFPYFNPASSIFWSPLPIFAALLWSCFSSKFVVVFDFPQPSCCIRLVFSATPPHQLLFTFIFPFLPLSVYQLLIAIFFSILKYFHTPVVFITYRTLISSELLITTDLFYYYLKIIFVI